MCDQPQYYRITDPLESLTIRIRLRKIFGRSVISKRTKARADRVEEEEREEADTYKNLGSFRPGDEVDVCIKWQEKIFSPREILAIWRGKHRHQRGTVSGKDPSSQLERDYAGHVEDMRREDVDPFESLSEVMLFTYTDKDGFVPPSDSTHGHLTTGNGGPHSHLEVAVVNMPRNTPTASLETPGRDGRGKEAGIVKRRGKRNGTGVSETAAAIQAHLIREDKFKVMYIMAAVDVDVGEITRVAKVRAAAAAARGRGEPGLFWSGGQDEEIHIHERVVCSIKAHQNGTLEIAPGFSEEQPESGDEGAFLTDHTVKVMDKEGARLTTYRFTSPSGGVFSYTVENDAELGDGVEEIEAWEVEESLKELWRKTAQQQAAGTQLHGGPPTEEVVALHAFLEIVSASGFMGVGRLYTEYALSLPRRWTMMASGDSIEGTAEDDSGGYGQDKTRTKRVTCDNEDSFAATGTTQVASQAYPLALPDCHLSPGMISACESLGGIGWRTSKTAPLSTTITKAGYGLTKMPSFFLSPPIQALGSVARLAVSSALLCLLALLWVLEASCVCWTVFTASVVILMALGGGAGGGEIGEGLVPVAHFSFPAEFHLINEEIGETAGIGERPQILLAVSSLDKLARHRVEGYGYIAFPRQSGTHDVLVRTWRPICSRWTHLQDFFVGGAHRLADPRYASKPESFKGSFLSRFGFRTESSGSLRVRLHLTEQGHVRESQFRQPCGAGGATDGPNIDLAGTRTVKEILRAVHTKRMSAKAGRRLGTTPANLLSSAAAAGSTAPAAVAAAAITATPSAATPDPERPETDGAPIFKEKATRERLTGEGEPALGYDKYAQGVTRVGFRGTSKEKDGGKVEAAVELLARVQEQLQLSEQRTKGAGSPAKDIAPPR